MSFLLPESLEPSQTFLHLSVLVRKWLIGHFFSNLLGKFTVPEWLRRKHKAVIAYHEEFTRDNEPDELWIRECAKRGWIILTKDRRIELQPRPRAAVLAFGAKVF
ncbi:MAG: hypothetical protein HY648_03285, partial [Acidobacteria bacterium]|nr:hypothetical protein [Acidobacteriota bacterium]